MTRAKIRSGSHRRDLAGSGKVAYERMPGTGRAPRNGSLREILNLGRSHAAVDRTAAPLVLKDGGNHAASFPAVGRVDVLYLLEPTSAREDWQGHVAHDHAKHWQTSLASATHDHTQIALVPHDQIRA